MNDTDTYGYVAIKPCGCRVGWCSESMETTRASYFGCSCGKVHTRQESLCFFPRPEHRHPSGYVELAAIPGFIAH